jgi:ArsR family transcriptional regulator, arsenate/arsenite/antimonite-responsive transcriptional repressor / arsenate reductase (thioredoxin)
MVSLGHAPPAFVGLAGHPVRWQLLTALAGGDQRVRELVEVVGQPQNLVSYHLRVLRDGGLVTATRSSFDGRDLYYHLDLDGCAEALAETGAALHPALRRNGAPGGDHGRITVLFVCTGNSVRSPIAEALLRYHSAGRVAVNSAGVRPRSQLHPDAVRVMRDEFSVDLAGRPKHVDTLADRRFDHVITLCDKARETCPEFHQSRRVHWSIPDAADYSALCRVARDIDTRVRHLLPVLSTTHQKEVEV